MARPSGTKNVMKSPNEKEEIVLEYLNGNSGYRSIARSHDLEPSVLYQWIKKYRNDKITGLISQTGKKTGGSKGQGPKKPKTKEERLKKEISKLEIEVARLKKGYLVKGVGAQKEYVTTFDVNMK